MTNSCLVEDITRLRDELQFRGFDSNGAVKDITFAEIVWKINSCLYKGYPHTLHSDTKALDDSLQAVFDQYSVVGEE